ncbi:copper chaperone PCu(A)C [Paracoccus pacificus]|uniref:Copper chaperone PCu(A)C n=1 Tax=Paracoccus pacificus TaxID=1463598 RepID=A0ABW4R830_9RHOB
MKRMLFIAACAALTPMAALAHDGLKIDDPYARVTGAKATSGAAFMNIENHKSVACTLSGVSTDVAERAELHTSTTDANGVTKMVKIENGIEIPANGAHPLTRGGDHLMLMGLKKPLADGDKFAVSFDFGECGKLDAEIPVDSARKPDAGAAGGEKVDHQMHMPAAQ